uniref:Uncharacterized protein n=1 Tax=Acanthochromis polyacanthus TaxID=80966 RepID=A0A3Q1FR44_9TELE
MLSSARTLFRQGQNWMFQQDNAPLPTSRATRTWLQEHSIQVFPGHDKTDSTIFLSHCGSLIE